MLVENKTALQDQQRILEALYGLLKDPTLYEKLVESLQAGYAQALRDAGGPEGSEEDLAVSERLAAVEPHFKFFADIFARFRLAVTSTTSGPAQGGAAPPQLHVDVTGNVVRADPSASRLLGIEIGDNASRLSLEAGDHHLLRSILREFASGRGDNRFTFLNAYVAPDDRRCVLLMSKGMLANGQPCGVIKVADLMWRDEIGATLSRTFDLTVAELDILRAVVSGQTLAEIAAIKARSIATVRTQAKSLLRKTEAKSQLELVRLFSAISLAMQGVETEQPTSRDGRRSFVVERECQRRMQIDVFGPEDGLPVFLVHGFVTGTAMTSEMIGALHTQNIKIIAPWRPAFAGSTPMDALPAAYPDIVCEDIVFAMKRFGIERAVLVARDSGMIYAGAAARRLGHSVPGVIAVAGTVPTRSRSQLDHIALWQRVFAYSARYLPAALPVLARGAMEMVATGKLDRLLDGLYATPPIDHAWARRPEIRDMLRESFESTFVQGTRGYELDARLSALDWTARSLAGLTIPVHYLHGRHDPISVLWQLEELAGLHPNIMIDVVEDGGQLIWYSHSERVVAAIARGARAALAKGKGER